MKLRLVDSVASLVLFSLAPNTIAALERELRRQKLTLVQASQLHAAAVSDTRRHISRRFLRDISVLGSFFEEESTFWLTRGLVSMSLSFPDETSLPPTKSPSISNAPTTWTSATASPLSDLPLATLSPSATIQPSAPPTSTTYRPSSSKRTLVPASGSLVPTYLPTSSKFTPSPSPSGGTALPTTELPPASGAGDTPSMSPSSSPNIDKPAILMCSKTEDLLVLAHPPYAAITAIPFKMGFVVESSNPLNEYLSSMELNILEAAAAGALQCNPGGALFGQNCSETCLDVSSQSIKTVKTGQSCEPEVSECTVFEISFDILVAENVDPEVSAFLGYVMLREEMDSGDFIRDVPEIDRIEYLSPLPLLPPSGEDGLEDQPLQADEVSSDQLSVSPWTLGTVVTMSLVGAIALGAWFRSRRNRNQRHQNLLEEMSVESPGHSTQM